MDQPCTVEVVQEAIPSGEFRRKFVISHGGECVCGSGEAAAAEEEVNESAEERGVELIRVPDCGSKRRMLRR